MGFKDFVSIIWVHVNDWVALEELKLATELVHIDIVIHMVSPIWAYSGYRFYRVCRV